MTGVRWKCRRRIWVGHKDGSAQGYNGQQGEEKFFHDALREERKRRLWHNRNVRQAKNYSVTKRKNITDRKQPQAAKSSGTSSNPALCRD
jgi:hypothetical protein